MSTRPQWISTRRGLRHYIFSDTVTVTNQTVDIGTAGEEDVETGSVGGFNEETQSVGGSDDDEAGGDD